MTIRAWAPGRVNLIGDHTDHTGGLVLPMAIDLGTTVTGQRGGEVVELRSSAEPEPAIVPLDVDDPSSVEPGWARYVAGVVAELRPSGGFRGTVDTTLPVGAGLSSSAALEVAVALALGVESTAVELARLCQRAEQRASGVPCGIMDQLASAAGVAGHALRIDCTTLDVRPVPVPDDLEVVVVDSGQRRSLATSAYADRAAACQAAQAVVGPLRSATVEDLAPLGDDVLRRRARHVITENARVDQLAAALVAGDRRSLADALAASHASLRDDFEVSTPVMDELVSRLVATPGVIGARLTGGGFGGCVVALTERATVLPDELAAWHLSAAGGARISGWDTGEQP
jgi:galactokinase